ncbi:hypothetical protein VCRA2133E348_210016 [Vibrio crassostreae]|nr:hypothetical protein VCRA2119O48_200016 [Vibrio crassostreae]CAK2765905.1 hypothetical protein VCRA2133E348_210016 [Vibrio crassostreae]CAK3226163.1 hypothetical protein VCRA213O314_190084 [Vibrio crassostreae]CAK3836403.1 hypothetical protein VCRA212O16_210016 [Vibrio crassostreae]
MSLTDFQLTMTSGFSGEKPALVPGHIILCQCETWGNDTYAGARAWVLVNRRVTGEELVPDLPHSASGNDIEFQFLLPASPGEQQVLG